MINYDHAGFLIFTGDPFLYGSCGSVEVWTTSCNVAWGDFHGYTFFQTVFNMHHEKEACMRGLPEIYRKEPIVTVETAKNRMDQPGDWPTRYTPSHHHRYSTHILWKNSTDNKRA
jgi:hypothetical protein